jgi:hypothetical protein
VNVSYRIILLLLGTTALIVISLTVASRHFGRSRTPMTRLPQQATTANVSPVGDAESFELPLIKFYGKVIDENDMPVAGAQVSLMIATADPNATLHRGQSTTKWITRYTDSEGNFSLVDEHGVHMWVSRIAKQGFEWINDSAEKTIFDHRKTLVGNQFYIFDPGIGPVYQSDPSRPAIFPLHREGSRVQGRPSRGGSDRYSDGKVVINERVTLLVPSAGPGSPATAIDRSERLRALLTPSTTRQTRN